MKKFLEVKEWFVNKNGLANVMVDSVLEIREKAVKVSMLDGEYTRTYWIPKSCLEIVADEWVNDSVYTNVAEANNIEEAIAMCKAVVSFDELVKMNRESYNDYR